MMKLLLAAVLTVAALCAQDTAANLTGTYQGSLMVATPDGERDMGATIVLKQADDGKLAVSAGPDADKQIAATDVKQENGRLTFRVQAPGEGDPWKFDVKVDAGRLTGTVLATRGTETREGKLDLRKQ